MVLLRSAKPFIGESSYDTCTKPVLPTTYGVQRGQDGISEVVRATSSCVAFVLAIITTRDKPSDLSDGELDRVLFQNAGVIMVRLLCP